MNPTHKRRARLAEAIQYIGGNAEQIIALVEDGKSQITMSRGFVVVRDSKPAPGIKSIYTITPSDWIAVGEDGVRRHYTDDQFLTKYEVI